MRINWLEEVRLREARKLSIAELAEAREMFLRSGFPTRLPLALGETKKRRFRRHARRTSRLAAAMIWAHHEKQGLEENELSAIVQKDMETIQTAFEMKLALWYSRTAQMLNREQRDNFLVRQLHSVHQEVGATIEAERLKRPTYEALPDS